MRKTILTMFMVASADGTKFLYSDHNDRNEPYKVMGAEEVYDDYEIYSSFFFHSRELANDCLQEAINSYLGKEALAGFKVVPFEGNIQF